VLIIEDTESHVALLETILRGSGYLAVVARDGFTGVRNLTERQFDAAIVDIQLPHLGGFQVLEQIRRAENVKNMPVIMMSATRLQSEDIQRALKLGADDFVVKPLDPQIVQAKLERVLKGKTTWHEYDLAASEVCAGTVELGLKIRAVNELGVRVESGVPLPSGKVVKISLDFFERLGLRANSLKVIESAKTARGNYLSYLAFAGLSDSDSKKIRAWCIQQKLGIESQYAKAHDMMVQRCNNKSDEKSKREDLSWIKRWRT